MPLSHPGALRVAHLSDLHFCAQNLEESDRCVGFAVQAAIEACVDVAVISGDATEHALEMHSPAIHALGRHMRTLSEHCPVLMLQGTFSHEPPGSLNLFRLLGGRYPICVADALQQMALMHDGSWVASPGWRFGVIPSGPIRALFSCIPTVNKAQVAAVVGGTGAAEAVGNQLAMLLAGLKPSNEQARARGIATIGVGHGTVNGCISEHGVPMASLDHEFTTACLFSAGADAFMLGHIHRHQMWEQGGRLIAYPGSIGRYHYGEPDEKGFLIWQFESGSVRADLVATPAKRTVELAFAGAPDLAELAAAVSAQSLKGAFVRVRWNVPEEERDQVDREAIMKVLGEAAQVKLEARIIPLLRTRAPGIAQQTSVEGKALAWAKATEVDPAPLMACLAALAEASPMAIAQGLLAAPAPPPGESTLEVAPQVEAGGDAAPETASGVPRRPARHVLAA